MTRTKHVNGWGIIPIGPHIKNPHKSKLPPPQMGECKQCHKPLELFGKGVVWTTETDPITCKTVNHYFHADCRKLYVSERDKKIDAEIAEALEYLKNNAKAAPESASPRGQRSETKR